MKTLFIKDFGAKVNTAEDSTNAFKSALAEAQKCGEKCEIVLETGNYNVYLPELFSIDINVSNTLGVGDCKQNGEIATINRNTPFLMVGMNDVTVDGCGAVINCHGKMSQIILKQCENITFKNIRFDTVNPTVTEMTVIKIGSNYMDCKISSDYPYKIENERIVWYGENYSFSTGISQLYNPNTGFTWRHYGPMDDASARFEEIEQGLVRLYFNSGEGMPNPYAAEVGYVFQMCDPIRDENGIIVSDCKNTSFINVTMHFMCGLGFIAQNCDGITLNGFNAYPSVGRTAACSADFMHFSGCRGKISIENGLFIGAHDDAVNVHGTHLKIVDVNEESKELKVRFMHPQTHGIGGFVLGDEIGVIDPNTLIELAKTKVTGVVELNDHDILLKLESTEGFAPELMIENISANAEVLIKNNRFERIPTRGILITTRNKVVIEDNEFDKVIGCGVLMADDARSWFESGHVTDVTVKNNTYKACADSFVRVEPECIEGFDKPIHSGIKIIDNLIEVSENIDVVYARNVDGLTFEGNIMYGKSKDCKITLNNVENESLNKNIYNGNELKRGD